MGKSSSQTSSTRPPENEDLLAFNSVLGEYELSLAVSRRYWLPWCIDSDQTMGCLAEQRGLEWQISSLTGSLWLLVTLGPGTCLNQDMVRTSLYLAMRFKLLQFSHVMTS